MWILSCAVVMLALANSTANSIASIYFSFLVVPICFTPLASFTGVLFGPLFLMMHLQDLGLIGQNHLWNYHCIFGSYLNSWYTHRKFQGFFFVLWVLYIWLWKHCCYIWNVKFWKLLEFLLAFEFVSYHIAFFGLSVCAPIALYYRFA